MYVVFIRVTPVRTIGVVFSRTANIIPQFYTLIYNKISSKSAGATSILFNFVIYITM